MNVITLSRITCLSTLTLAAALAQAATPVKAVNGSTVPQLSTQTTMSSNTIVVPTQPPQLAPPDLAMIALTPSKTTVNRMEPFKLSYTIKNVGKTTVSKARVAFTATYYPLSASVDVGSLAPGAEKTGTVDMTVMTDSMMGMSPEPWPVHITYTATAVAVGGNGGAMADLHPADNEKSSTPITANPG